MNLATTPTKNPTMMVQRICIWSLPSDPIVVPRRAAVKRASYRAGCQAAETEHKEEGHGVEPGGGQGDRREAERVELRRDERARGPAERERGRVKGQKRRPGL